MSKAKSAQMRDHLEELTDPRRREITYPLINVVVIAVCAVICGADDFVAIAKFGNTKRDWFARFVTVHECHPQLVVGGGAAVVRAGDWTETI